MRKLAAEEGGFIQAKDSQHHPASLKRGFDELQKGGIVDDKEVGLAFSEHEAIMVKRDDIAVFERPEWFGNNGPHRCVTILLAHEHHVLEPLHRKRRIAIPISIVLARARYLVRAEVVRLLLGLQLWIFFFSCFGHFEADLRPIDTVEFAQEVGQISWNRCSEG